eukprot:7288018-Alexandrium_andersonii.AAC.1
MRNAPRGPWTRQRRRSARQRNCHMASPMAHRGPWPHGPWPMSHGPLDSTQAHAHAFYKQSPPGSTHHLGHARGMCRAAKAWVTVEARAQVLPVLEQPVHGRESVRGLDQHVPDPGVVALPRLDIARELE